MDGTLLNTEDLYTEASTEALAKYGKGPLTWDIKLDLQGRPGLEATRRVVDFYDLPVTPEQFMAETYAIQAGKWNRTAYLPGALELLQALNDKKIPMALGSSSSTTNYLEKTRHLPGFDVFKRHIVLGDDARIRPGRGKPNPDIWLVCLESINRERALKRLGKIAIEECVIFEDGIPGVISGRDAGAHVVWIPHPEAVPHLKEEFGGKVERVTLIADFDIARCVA